MYRVWGFALLCFYLFIWVLFKWWNSPIRPHQILNNFSVLNYFWITCGKYFIFILRLTKYHNDRERWNFTWILTFNIYIDVPYFCATHFTCSLTNFLGLEIRSKLVQNILSINCAIKFQPYHLVHVRIPSIFSILYLQVFSQLKYKVAR